MVRLSRAGVCTGLFVFKEYTKVYTKKTPVRMTEKVQISRIILCVMYKEYKNV